MPQVDRTRFRVWIAALSIVWRVLCAASMARAAEPARTSDPAPSAAKPIELTVAESWPINHELHHVQGLAVTDQWFWITSVDRRARRGFVYRVSRETLKVVAERDITLDAQCHPGGLQLVADRLWIPVAEYRPRSTSTMLELDPTSLATLDKFTLGDHLGGAAVDAGRRVYTANWDARTIYVLDTAGKEVERRDNPTGVAYQDFEFHDGKLYCAGNTKLDAAGNTKLAGQPTAVVDVIDVATWTLVKRYSLRGELRSGGSNFCREGFCKFGDSFYVLPEDGPNATVYRFAIPTGDASSAKEGCEESGEEPAKEDTLPNEETPPKEVDLRPQFARWNLAPRRQGRRNTCSVFVTAAALEFALAKYRDAGAPLSVEYLNWACNQEIGNTTADRGQFFHDLLKGFARHGICREELMPYERRFANTQPDEAAQQDADETRQLNFQTHCIRRWSKSSGLSDAEFAETRRVLAAGWPVCAGSNHSRLFVGYADNAYEPGGGTFITRDSGVGRYSAVSYEWARANLYDLFWVEIAGDEDAPPAQQADQP